ncbi:ATP-binding protein [Sorangium sp. So ce295]|uniref:ATP-binding protein n=1 Tax=Sorangium sp. So ce295 TaxID=3133295 RepID=UPI003F6208FB
MTEAIDLQQLSIRESEQTEWKENVADIDGVVETLSAFANDLANLGGGYVVCGAREDRDPHGFPVLVRTGLTANRLREVENTVLARCRDRVSPPITPRAEELASDTPERRILVFIQPATDQAHTFRRDRDGAKHFVRVSRSTIEARNGVLRNLLVRKGAVEPWDRRPCTAATINDLDLLALRDALQRMGVFSPERGVEPYLSEDVQLSPFVPPLCVREPLTGVLRPRNFAVLLFGRETQRFAPGAFSLFSIYPGVDRSDPHAERHELPGNLLEQARRLTELLDVQSYTAFDKSDPASPNSVKYPKRALYEAMGNALAHRDYEIPDPTRITVFSDRIEVLSPGSLPLGVDVAAFREGRSPPKWRNQTLAWFFNRLQLAQAEGQGIPTILRVMREEGCPPPTLEADEIRVLCVLPAHPRHALLRDLRAAEQALVLGELRKAQDQVRLVLDKDPLNSRALQLFAEVQHAVRDSGPVKELVAKHVEQIDSLPAAVLVQLAEALVAGDAPPESTRALSQRLLASASRGRLEERELRRIAVAMLRARQEEPALLLIERHLQEHPEWERNASLLQLRGDTLLGLAKRCRTTAKKRGIPPQTKQRAWREFHAYLARAERDLTEALSRSVDDGLTGQIHRNVEYLEQLRRENSPPGRGRR